MNLQHLDRCVVKLLDHSETVQVDFVKNSKIFIGSWLLVFYCARLLSWWRGTMA